jgi:hypothetical protein
MRKDTIENEPMRSMDECGFWEITAKENDLLSRYRWGIPAGCPSPVKVKKS